jgi:hypothetical protein
MMGRAVWVVMVALSGCIRAPEIVVVDQATALEQQAGGSFAALEQELVAEATGAGPVALTPNELEALGIRPRPLVDTTEQTEADRLDALLVQHCVGEGRDGLLVDTEDDCAGSVERTVLSGLVERTNRARVRLWQWMHAQRPGTSLDELRKAWREAHLGSVVCQGWVQRADGTWEAKAC